jgi:hypothetical protein
MTDTKRIVAGLLFWTGVISAAHFRLNVDWSSVANAFLPEALRKLNVAYVPVT